MRFQFATANRIIFGLDALAEIGDIVAGLGHRALVVTGRTVHRAEPLLELLGEAGVDYASLAVEQEPTIEIAQRGTQRARASQSDFVISFGGGSVIDTGKAIAALLTNSGDPFDYLEVIGRGLPLTQPAAPHIAIPTTAGTGTEVTRNAVLASPEHRVKVSLRSPLMIPTVALIDPKLTRSVPPEITAYTGLDALTQVIEPYVSRRANPLTDAVCREGIQRAARALSRAYENGDDLDAREDMAVAALCGGLALANAQLGAVHGFAGPFGGMYHAPHGAVCAALLPHVMTANIEILEARAPGHPALRRYDHVAQWLTGDASASARDGAVWVRELCLMLNIAPLSDFGLSEKDFDTLVEKAAQSSSMKGNPIELMPDELRAILRQAM